MNLCHDDLIRAKLIMLMEEAQRDDNCLVRIIFLQYAGLEETGHTPMGIFSFLFGNRKRPKVSEFKLAGDGTFSFEVVGESHRQKALEDIAGGRSEDSAEVHCIAKLVPEPDNPNDRDAVRVEVEGYHVAYLSRKDAKRYKLQLSQLEIGNSIGECNALVVGGWIRDHGEDTGHFGIKLDLVWPIKII